MEPMLNLEPSPREIADETLQMLISFTQSLIQLSIDSGERLWAGEDIVSNFHRLTDGIEILMEGVTTSKAVMQISSHQLTDNLQKELIELLNALAEAMSENSHQGLEQRSQILRESLPAHLKRWAEQGIPSLIRSRDS